MKSTTFAKIIFNIFMAKKLQYFLFTIFFIATSLEQACAQNGVESPYSRYGWGLLSDRSMGFNKAMAGVAQGFRDGQEINISNPASYSAVDSLTALFDLGMNVSYNNYKLDNLQQHVRNASFDYGAFHFRATKGLGIAVAVVPFSKIKYSISGKPVYAEGSNNSITSTTAYSGTGGFRQAVLGVGYRIIKPLSVGVNAGVLWGEYAHTVATSYSSGNTFPNTKIYSADIITYTLDFGLQYTQKLNSTDDITLGGTYTLGHNINKPAILTISTIGENDVPSTDYTLQGALSLPHSFAVGLAYRHSNKVRVGADYELQYWSKARFPRNEDYEKDYSNTPFVPTTGTLNDRHKATAGIEYTPDMYSKSYAKRISYKFGGYYSTMYAKQNEIVNQKPTEFGLTAGVTLPITNRNLFRSTPKINLAVSWTHTNIPYLSNRTVTEPIIGKLTEDYVKLSIGVTISERWFYKYKIQ